ncbi:UNKNOWN [Stylonychia lemnae]|uniref:Uncharacterized protein n=1 Tax=Stylonychia lemnae TaxID=5949 RepID=A0A078AHQ6_STYLE|nr:UNKNOWN [Stylonychia lemnae]|eukprot:CDW81810.1 UNKNOWN [Stylonychia lemnae]
MMRLQSRSRQKNKRQSLSMLNTQTITPKNQSNEQSLKNIIDLSKIKNLNETTKQIPIINEIIKIVSPNGLNNGEIYGPNRVIINKIALQKSKPQQANQMIQTERPGEQILTLRRKSAEEEQNMTSSQEIKEIKSSNASLNEKRIIKSTLKNQAITFQYSQNSSRELLGSHRQSNNIPAQGKQLEIIRDNTSEYVKSTFDQMDYYKHKHIIPATQRESPSHTKIHNADDKFNQSFTNSQILQKLICKNNQDEKLLRYSQLMDDTRLKIKITENSQKVQRPSNSIIFDSKRVINKVDQVLQEKREDQNNQTPMQINNPDQELFLKFIRYKRGMETNNISPSSNLNQDHLVNHNHDLKSHLKFDRNIIKKRQRARMQKII